MGKKIFISYKYGDENVRSVNSSVVAEAFNPTKARDYVTKLQSLLSEKNINKGEKDDESLEDFKDETIRSKLADKIFDSTVTIVLISPNMKDSNLSEDDQWIPWEISYSLKNKNRSDNKSYMNAIIAVVLPDKNNSYEYYIKENTCSYCKCRTLEIYSLFYILRENIFNIKEPTYNSCNHHNKPVYTGESSYIMSIKWDDFIIDAQKYINRSLDINNNHNNYNIVKKTS